MVKIMKRAAMLVLAIATLILIGIPDGSLYADTSSSRAVTRSHSGVYVSPWGGGEALGGPEDGGSTRGDADGLSGIKNRVVATTVGPASGSSFSRVVVSLENWVKFMLWIR
jgi:hypothetical protein